MATSSCRNSTAFRSGLRLQSTSPSWQNVRAKRGEVERQQTNPATAIKQLPSQVGRIKDQRDAATATAQVPTKATSSCRNSTTFRSGLRLLSPEVALVFLFVATQDSGITSKPSRPYQGGSSGMRDAVPIRSVPRHRLSRPNFTIYNFTFSIRPQLIARRLSPLRGCSTIRTKSESLGFSTQGQPPITPSPPVAERRHLFAPSSRSHSIHSPLAPLLFDSPARPHEH